MTIFHEIELEGALVRIAALEEQVSDMRLSRDYACRERDAALYGTEVADEMVTALKAERDAAIQDVAHVVLALYEIIDELMALVRNGAGEDSDEYKRAQKVTRNE
jgi:hypothetical protein